MYQFWISNHFIRQIKPLVKKHRHLKEDIYFCLKSFDKRQNINIGNNVYKVRLKSSDIKRGKSKALRLIVFIYEKRRVLTPLLIYFKGDKENISQKEINFHLSKVILEIEPKRVLN